MLLIVSSLIVLMMVILIMILFILKVFLRLISLSLMVLLDLISCSCFIWVLKLLLLLLIILSLILRLFMLFLRVLIIFLGLILVLVRGGLRLNCFLSRMWILRVHVHHVHLLLHLYQKLKFRRVGTLSRMFENAEFFSTVQIFLTHFLNVVTSDWAPRFRWFSSGLSMRMPFHALLIFTDYSEIAQVCFALIHKGFSVL